MLKWSSATEVTKAQWFRQTVKLVLDVQLGLLAWLIILELIPGIPFTGVDLLIWVATLAGCVLAFRITRQHYRMVGIDDFFGIMLATTATFLVSSIAYRIIGGQGHRKLYLFLFFASFFTGIFWSILRITIRSIYEFRLPFPSWFLQSTSHGKRTLIVGAGRAGFLAAEELKRHAELGSQIVGFVDDAFEKQGLRIQGVPVLGTTELLSTVIKENGISRVIIAIPSAPGPVIRKLSNVVRSAGVELKTVPGIYNLLGNQTWQPEIRDVSIEDLLRRDPIQLDQTALGRALGDAVVLITGGGGSIGSEIARQVAAYHPSRVVLLGRGENSLWIAERELRMLFPGLPLGIELCDIRQAGRLRQVFHRWKPQIVFHAAAHKHVPFLEMHPEEAIENNVFGTENVLKTAIGIGTRVFVNISTDKSVNPTNVLGVSKCLAEGLVRAGAAHAGPGSQYVSVRFGNVLGSRGSVIPIFKEQIRQGGPVTITDPQMTRYFMTIPEASQLVLQAGLLGRTGKVYVLDMGDPVRILDLAKDLIALSGVENAPPIDIQFTGIRPGEKLFEELFNTNEIRHTQVHPKVFEARQDSTDPAALEAGLTTLRRALAIENERKRKAALAEVFTKIITTYHPSSLGLGAFLGAGDPGEPLQQAT